MSEIEPEPHAANGASPHPSQQSAAWTTTVNAGPLDALIRWISRIFDVWFGFKRHARNTYPSFRSKRQWYAMLSIIVVGVAVTLLFLWVAHRVFGTGVAWNILIYASLAALFVTVTLTWVDRHEPEPTLWRMTAFCWGAGAAVAGTLITTALAEVLGIDDAVQSTTLRVLPEANSGAFVLAPIIEEVAKGLGLVVIYRIVRHEINGLIDLVVYAGFIAVGFAFVENIIYLTAAYGLKGSTGLSQTFVIRGIFTPFAHPIFTWCTAVGLFIALNTKTSAVLRVLALLGGLGAGVMLHALWNLWSEMGLFLAFFLAFEIPLFLMTMGVLAWLGLRERTLIRRWSQPYITAGWFTRDQVLVLMGQQKISQKVSRRAKARLRNASEALGDLSYLRRRMHNRTAPPNAKRVEVELLNEIHDHLSAVDVELRSQTIAR